MAASDTLLIITTCTTGIIAIMTPILAFMVQTLATRTVANGVKADEAKAASEKAAKTVAEAKSGTDGKLNEIHTLVNSSLSAAQAQVAALINENQTQKETITRLTPPPDSVMALTNKLRDMESEMARMKALIPISSSGWPPPAGSK
jgi:hypothetical protein